MSATSPTLSRFTSNYDPDLLNGWRVRASDWTFGASIQQQILPRASVEVAYTRRWYNGFTINDNQLVQKSDYTAYSIVAPLDPRLPNGGGYTVSGLYDVAPTLSGQILNLVTDSRQYGKWDSYFNGVDVSLNVRTRGGLTLQGGTSTGQNVADVCEVRTNLPELNAGIGAGLVGSNVTTTSPDRHVAYAHSCEVLALYTIPKVDVQVSVAAFSKPGALLAANYTVTNAEAAKSLGRNLSGNATQVTVNLVEPGSMYGDRLNQLDFRVAKLLKIGRGRAMIGVDMFNALNASTILTYNNTFVPGGTWLQPSAVLTARMAKITAEFTF